MTAWITSGRTPSTSMARGWTDGSNEVDHGLIDRTEDRPTRRSPGFHSGWDHATTVMADPYNNYNHDLRNVCVRFAVWILRQFRRTQERCGKARFVKRLLREVDVSLRSTRTADNG